MFTMGNTPRKSPNGAIRVIFGAVTAQVGAVTATYGENLSSERIVKSLEGSRAVLNFR